jgi:hypothetical protein
MTIKIDKKFIIGGGIVGFLLVGIIYKVKFSSSSNESANENDSERTTSDEISQKNYYKDLIDRGVPEEEAFKTVYNDNDSDNDNSTENNSRSSSSDSVSEYSIGGGKNTIKRKKGSNKKKKRKSKKIKKNKK